MSKVDGREMEVVSVRTAAAGKTAIYCAWGLPGSHRVIRRFLADQIDKIPKPAKDGPVEAAEATPQEGGGDPP
ncbi:hypothetical protein [Phreatobacter stygius]|uniref:Uncharacterized protein n=1 Tax=Phreatobacter stygius TaxID=1940610 RepID=A0A4D7BD62_9HYPH|nr:hypothetical protein [Phreatobacter stygius]QCI68523.1 hypothetical protein E8M01_32425 [Phreatobacter stygius]